MRAKAGSGGAQLELVAGDNVSGGSVSTARIDADNIILDGTVTATQIAAGTITANEIASSAITAAKLAAGSVNAAKIAAGAITSNELTVNIRSDIGAGTGNGNSNLTNNNVSISGNQISAGSITSAKLTNNIRSDIGAGTGNGNGNSNLTNNNVSISGSRITSGTVAAGRMPSEALNENEQYNLADPRNWDIGTDAGDGYGRTGTFNENDSSDNERIMGVDAFGTESIIWQTIPDSGSSADGGWNCDFTIYKTQDALLYVNYVKRTSSDAAGNYYLGCHGNSTLSLNGTANTNPYFVAKPTSDLPQNVWCAIVGVIYGSSSTVTSNAAIGGVYRLDTGAKIRSCNSFRMKTGVTVQRHRAYLYYSTNNTVLQFCKPGVYVINGSEPTLGQILGPAAAINAGSVDVDGTSIKDSSITSTQLTNNIRSDIGAGTGNGNSNLTNNNVSISGSRITSGTVSDSRLANNVSKKGNTGNLFASSTNISGGQINTGIVTGGNLTINSTNYQPNAGNGGFALGIPASGTGAGRFVVGSADEFMWWDGSRLKLQGEVINVGPEYTSGRLLTKYVFDRASVGNISGNNTGAQSITGILDQLGGAGVYGFAICGGGGGGANTRPSNHKAFGGGAGGMALFVYDWNGSEAITVNLGTGGTANNDNNNNFSANGNAGNGSTFAIAGNTRVTANGGAAGNRATNGTATAVNSGQTRANATFNAANTDFPAFSHICTSGISGGTGAAHQAGMGGGGIQITPWNPTGVFTLANSADSGTTPVTNSNNYGYGSSGGCPWGPGVATGGSNNTRVSNSPFRLDAGSAGLSGTTTNSPPGDRVVHPVGYDGYYDADETRISLMFGATSFRGGDGGGGGNTAGTASSGGLFCGGGGSGRRSSNLAIGGDGGLGGGGGGASSYRGNGNIGGDGGDGAVVIWRIS